MSSDQQVSNSYDFSNATLIRWLAFARAHVTPFESFIAKLGVDPSWFDQETQWHSADFHEHFIRIFTETYGLDALEEIKKKSSQDTTRTRLSHSTLSLLITPQRILDHMPRIARRTDRYSSLSFNFHERKLLRSSASLSKAYRDPHRRELNSQLCEDCHHQIQGLFKTLGYQLLSVTEDSCIRNGDAFCRYQIEWINRISLRKWAIATLPLLTIAFCWHMGYLLDILDTPIQLGHLVLGLLSGVPIVYLLGHANAKRRLTEAFHYQQETLDKLHHSLDMQQRLNQEILEYQKQYEQTLALAQIGEISYGIVHDMASSIQLIKMGSDLIDRRISTDVIPKTDTSGLHQNFALIKKSTDHLITMQNLLRRAVSLHRSNPWIEMDLCKVVRETVSLYRVAAARSGIEMELVLKDCDSLWIHTIESYIERSLINLLNNAINALRHHPARKITVTLACATNSNWILSISDTGPGIPAERLDQLFRKFGYSSDSSSESRKGDGNEIRGTGWGLYSIRSFMSDMEVEFKVESNSNGTTAVFVLPPHLMVSANPSTPQAA